MEETLVSLDPTTPFWTRFFTVAPLVVVGTREADGGYDLAPKHLCTPLSWSGWFGFVCTPAHRTWHNIERSGAFTVSFVGPEHLVASSLAAGPRYEGDAKPTLAAVPVFDASEVDGVLISGCPLYLECTMDRMLEGFGENGLVVGRVVAVRVRSDHLRGEDIDDGELIAKHPFLVYVHPDRYGILERTQTFPLHRGFKR